MEKYIFLFLIVLALAALEVQIEGEFGWTKNLPTWRIKSKIFGYFMGGKELTGYLFYLLTVLLLFFHLPFFFGLKWTVSNEFEILMIFFLFSVFWDLLWFVLNPHYGIKKLNRHYVSWHRDWISNIPVDYLRGIAVAFICSIFIQNDGLFKWLWALGIFVAGTIITILINELLRKIKSI